MRSIGLGFLVLTSPLWATDINTVVSRGARILDITSIKEISRSVDTALPYMSKLVMEIEGKYEGHGTAKKVGLRLDRTDDGRPGNYMAFNALLYGIMDVTGPIELGQRPITAVSNPEDFKVQILVQPVGWYSTDPSFEANIAFTFIDYTPIRHEVTRGFTASLRTRSGTLSWDVHNYGFPTKP